MNSLNIEQIPVECSSKVQMQSRNLTAAVRTLKRGSQGPVGIFLPEGFRDCIQVNVSALLPVLSTSGRMTIQTNDELKLQKYCIKDSDDIVYFICLPVSGTVRTRDKHYSIDEYIPVVRVNIHPWLTPYFGAINFMKPKDIERYYHISLDSFVDLPEPTEDGMYEVREPGSLTKSCRASRPSSEDLE